MWVISRGNWNNLICSLAIIKKIELGDNRTCTENYVKGVITLLMDIIGTLLMDIIGCCIIL